MRLPGVFTALGLLAAAAAAEQPKGDKATVEIVGAMTAAKDSTLNYTLKKGGKVIAEGKGVAALPAKGVEVAAADAAGPFELTLSAAGGVVRVTQIGVSVTSGGKTSKDMFGGRLPFDLNARDPFGVTLRAVTFPLTPTPVPEPRKMPDIKKTDDTKKPTESKKTDDTKKKTADTKKTDEPKKKADDTKKPEPAKLPIAPMPTEK